MHVAFYLSQFVQWTNCIIDKIFKNIEIVKSITTALKSILILVKLQSLVAKYCKMQKLQACKIRQFCILLYYGICYKRKHSYNIMCKKDVLNGLDFHFKVYEVNQSHIKWILAAQFELTH